jgi:hypothetical protein
MCYPSDLLDTSDSAESLLFCIFRHGTKPRLSVKSHFFSSAQYEWWRGDRRVRGKLVFLFAYFSILKHPKGPEVVFQGSPFHW